MRDSMIGLDGLFVVFEGIDGAGTSTQIERFAAALRAKKRLVHVTREPSGGPIGSLIRLVLTERVTLPARNAGSMALLFAADRLDHLECEVAPLLRDGYIVLSDRYDLSSLTYQTATSDDENSSVTWVRELNKQARRPDVTLVIDTSPEVAATRRRHRGGPHELYDDNDLQARLGALYRRAEELVPGDRVVHVDGDGDVETVADAVFTALEPFVR
jgi:dTMP kinase